MSKQELKPCPFCGCEALDFDTQNENSISLAVFCGGCGAQGPLTYGEEKAAKAWNNRVNNEKD